MKKKFLIFLLLLVLLICLNLFYFSTHFNDSNQICVKNLSEFKLNLDKDKYPFLGSIYDHRKNYKKNFYHMQPELDGINDRSIIESWTFESNGKTYYAFQNNLFLNLKKEDEDLSKTHYSLAIYDSNKKLITEIVDDKGKYEKLIHMVFRKENTLDATLISIDPKTDKINKKIHKMIKIPAAEYISGISDYLTIVPYNKVLELKNKTFCIYSEDELKLNNYSYNIINKKTKTKNEPWDIEFEEVGEDSDNPIHSRCFFDSEKNIIYKSSYGNISSVLTDSKEINSNECTRGDNKAAKINIPLNFWLINRDNLDELKLKITFSDKNSDIYIKKTPRQKINKLNDSTILLTLTPEKFTYKSSEKISKKDISDALETSLNYPSNDLRIQELAHSITGHAKDNLEKSFLIMNWIDKNIKWTYDSNTEVLQTLDTKKGDCSERSALFITLARASGIPAVFSGGYAIGIDSLGGHAWVKILENNRWMELDPSNPGFISTCYLTTDPSLLPKDIKDVQIVEIKYKNEKAKIINTKKPFIKHDKDFYSNRILGISFKMPDYAKLELPKKGMDNALLFKVSMKSSIFKLQSLAKNYQILETQDFILASDYDKNLFKENHYAKKAHLNGIEIETEQIIKQEGKTLLAEKFTIPHKKVAGIIYEYPLKSNFTINFLVIGDTDSIDSLYLTAKVPPLFVDILKNAKRVNQEF